MTGYRLLPPAESELDDIWLYIARQSGRVDVANSVIEVIADRLWLIGQHPHIGRRRDHDLRPGLRTLTVGEYVIVYRVENQEALILHIIRGSRDIPAHID